MNTADIITAEMTALRDEREAMHLMRFFKCGPGMYGEGDRFLGIRVPTTRQLVKQYWKEADLSDALQLVESPWHEIRLAGFLLLVETFNKRKREKDDNGMKEVIDSYLGVIHRGNNWDLVDLIAPKLLGTWILIHPEESELLYQLADKSMSLWHQRVAIVANWTLIRAGVYSHTFRIAELYLNHSHDLIHKATGWMLRETGKRGGMSYLTDFLDIHSKEMPRTMLRYSLEKFPEPLRRHYMNK